MSNSISTLRICRQAAVLVILTLAGCDLEDSPLQPVAVDDATDLPALAPPAGALTGTADDDWPGESMFRQMAAVEPSFTGYFSRAMRVMSL